MTGFVSLLQSGANRGPEMPTTLWLIAAAGMWLAAVGATCALLTMTKIGPRREGPPENDAAGLVEPGISAIAPGGPRPQRPPERVDVDQSASGDSYALHVREDVVARLHWRNGPGRPAGWYLTQRSGGWQRLTVDAYLDADVGPAARPSGWQQAADLAPTLSTALALDAAANVLRGPATTPPRPLPRGPYEVHTAGLAFDPIAFPEAITTRASDTPVLTGHFDDRGLTVLTRRIAILGGHVLAIFPAEQPHAPYPAA